VTPTGPESRAVVVVAETAPQTARHIAAQVAGAMTRNAERVIDVILNPAELGRVRITLSHGDAGMIVNVGAERAETLDLMRRHSDLLGQEFHDLGYGDTDFSFSQDRHAAEGRGPQNRARTDAPDQSLASATTIPDARQSTIISLDRLDIRL
jgi:flagellar hook-length control protein FliK